MKPELYFDISTMESGGSLFRQGNEDGTVSFVHQHSIYDDNTGDIKVFETTYPSFEAFWKELTKDPEWFYQHPLYVHPEVRRFIQDQLQNVDWSVQGNRKWQESHQRQWKKVLTDPGNYYTF